MTKDEIIDGIVAAPRAGANQEAKQPLDDLDYEVIIRDALTSKLTPLRPEQLVRMCADFGHMGIECCESCHIYCPHYELALPNVECGGQARICCAVNRVLNPHGHQKLRESADDREIESWLSGAIETGEGEER